MKFALNKGHAGGAIAAALAANGRVQIRGFLEPESAEALLGHLADSDEWRHVLNAGDNVYEVTCHQLAAMEEAQRTVLDRKVDEEAAGGFQFRFDTIRVPDDADGRVDAGPLADFASFLSSPPMIDWFRALTGCQAIDFADCQATRYRSGAFLTRHDDAVEGKSRHFAYVLGLTRGWRAEWGGLLLFPDDDAACIEALVPQFNLLTLFEVGQQHCVSQVASYAPIPRYSVTGWLRSRA